MDAKQESGTWIRRHARFPYSEEHRQAALDIANQLGFQLIQTGPFKGTLQRPWSHIAKEMQNIFPELSELGLHRLRGAVNRWLDESVREREKVYQQNRRDQMKEDDRLAMLSQKKLYAEDPEIRRLINEGIRERKAARADVRITSNFRSRFAALLKGGELAPNEYGFSFGLAEQLYRPCIEALAGELDAAILCNPSEKWVIDHKRPLASYPLSCRVNLLGEAWSPLNLEVISQSDNAKKSSIWFGRRWTYSTMDGDRCHAEACVAWRERFPEAPVTPVLQAYLDGTWRNSDDLLKVIGLWQQALLKNKTYRNQVPVLIENSLLNQRGWRPEAISWDNAGGPATVWSSAGEEKATAKMLEAREENLRMISEAGFRNHKKRRRMLGFGDP